MFLLQGQSRNKRAKHYYVFAASCIMENISSYFITKLSYFIYHCTRCNSLQCTSLEKCPAGRIQTHENLLSSQIKGLKFKENQEYISFKGEIIKMFYKIIFPMKEFITYPESHSTKTFIGEQ